MAALSEGGFPSGGMTPRVVQEARIALQARIDPHIQERPNKTDTEGGPLTFVDSTTALPGASHAQGGFTPGMSPAREWFDRVHVLPKTAINFGNVITPVTQTFELFNAYRTDSDLQTFTNNAGAGVTIPNLPSLPTTVGPLTSLLDPSSTRLSAVLLSIQVDDDGPARFNNTLDFLWAPGGTVSLTIIGNRITLIIGEPENPFRERLEWLTNIIPKRKGREQRIRVRKQPRQFFDHRFRLLDLDRRLTQALLFNWQGRQFALPLWHDYVRLTADVSSGTALAVTDATDIDMRVGGLLVVFKDARTFDVLGVDAVATNLITAGSAVTNSYEEGDLVVPIRTAYIPNNVRSRRPPVKVEEFSMSFRVSDNDTGALTGDLTPFSTPSELGGKLLLDECNLVEGAIQDNFDLRVETIDGEAGLVFQEPIWDVNRRGAPYVIRARSRAEIKKFRRMFLALNGRQVSFYVATKIEDMVPTQPLSIGTNVLTIENIQYTRFIQSQQPKATFRITFDDDTSLIRTVQSSIEDSDTEETLTLNDTWPAGRTVSEIVRIEFLEKVRQGSDELVIDYDYAGNALFRTSTYVDLNP